MSEHVFNLVDLLACPDCGADIITLPGEMKCTKCSRRFEVRRGIPILYPSNFREDRLKCEETLAEIMAQSNVSDGRDIVASQWQQSKMEFWSAVIENAEPPPRSFLNVGCGYDANFRNLQNRGYSFVNFDLIYEILEVLKLQHDSEYCVVGDANHLPFKEESYDYLTCIDVIHHESESIVHLLKGFHSLLKPGGALFLEDINAWAVYQFPKSILLPKSSFRSLRTFYHSNLKKSTHRPADYEFPTNPFNVARILKHIGFVQIVFFENRAYPTRHEFMSRIYNLFGDNERVAKFHNFHYSLMARKH